MSNSQTRCSDSPFLPGAVGDGIVGRVNAAPIGLFIGLTTLDIIYRAQTPLGRDEKQVAQDYQLCPGGPATNAAIAFAQLSCTHSARLAAAIGQHPLAEVVRADAQQWQVELVDLAPAQQEPPSLSSILVNAETGERSVVSINAQRQQVSADLLAAEHQGDGSLQSLLLNGTGLVLVDGHQMALSAAIALLAQTRNIPVVVDGGSWKPGFEAVLAAADYALCSATFRPPGCHSEAEALAYLQEIGVSHIAFTHGSNPITYWQREAAVRPATASRLASGSNLDPEIKLAKDPQPATDHPRDRSGQIAVPQIQAVDTLGAGDIFHGAFCHYILEQDFPRSLAAASAIASQACLSFGTRRWLEQYK